jgi:hypothetical protein
MEVFIDYPRYRVLNFLEEGGSYDTKLQYFRSVVGRWVGRAVSVDPAGGDEPGMLGDYRV